ncbi:unnamed protein product [Cyberlindnera jadinii]|uniref:Uncharacterized protein n=1 Tax=Cyberlindnera jadinii (strain ATCC 18201 / CBS 1600 / BCRC 20928 / JCM 3617 / NBRC 0987 / NRRL Y-1542) TaxID=983966 RepID=A0A0H5CH36_CYBJN|nr:unnamed protein product [Cyberlindnera jadinii]
MCLSSLNAISSIWWWNTHTCLLSMHTQHSPPPYYHHVSTVLQKGNGNMWSVPGMTIHGLQHLLPGHLC